MRLRNACALQLMIINRACMAATGFGSSAGSGEKLWNAQSACMIVHRVNAI